MKLLRKKAMPVAPYTVMCNHSEKLQDNLATLDSEPGYFQKTISEMLLPGQEQQLICWLKTVGVLPPVLMCKNASRNNNCNTPMCLIPASNMDVYQWKCPSCMEKRKIREDTVFRNVKCRFRDVIRLLLGWSEGNSVEMMADLMDVKKAAIKTVYNIASNSARDYLRGHISQFRLGGPGIVVLIDTFPDPNSNIGEQEYSTKSRLILCIAEIKEDPTRFYFHCLDRYSKTATELIANINAHALKVVQNIVLPGSVIVANSNTTICSYNTLKSLKHIFPVMVSTDGLQRHDSALQSLAANLDVIWGPALRICEEAQHCRHAEVTTFLARYLFCQHFGKGAFEKLLNQLSY